MSIGLLMMIFEHRGNPARFAISDTSVILGNIPHVSACNAYRGMLGDESTEEYVERLAEELDNEFVRVGVEKVCAFVAEPVVGGKFTSSSLKYSPSTQDRCCEISGNLILS